MSSDGHASLPIYDAHNNLIGFEVGQESSLLHAFQQAVLEFNVPLEKALMAITQNPAHILGLAKGQIKVAGDADLVLLRKEDLAVDSVWSNGQAMVLERQIIQKGFFS
jgi:beta-aspartyl-dipeptidase (metallo-type)